MSDDVKRALEAAARAVCPQRKVCKPRAEFDLNECSADCLCIDEHRCSAAAAIAAFLRALPFQTELTDGTRVCIHKVLADAVERAAREAE